MISMLRKTLSAAGLALALCLPVLMGAPAFADGHRPVIIIDATVHTVGPQGVLTEGDVLFADGRIRAVGTDLEIPDGALVIGGAGTLVTPGFMTAGSSLGLVEVSAEASNRDNRSDGSAPFSAALDVAPAVNPNSTLIPVTRIEGVTRAITGAGPNATIFAGMGAAIHLGHGPDLVVKPRVAQFVALGGGGARIAGGTRPQAFAVFEEAIRQTREREARPLRIGRMSSHEEPIMSRRDLEALVPAVNGTMPFAVDVDRSADILWVLKTARRYGLRVILVSAVEAWMVADEIAAAGVPVVLRPSDNLPQNFEALGARLDAAARLHKAGVTIALSGFDTHNARLLPQQAGLAVANGLPHKAALEALTINPARIFGIDTVYGSLEPGKDADVVVWDGDPLEVTSAPRKVFIQGKAVPMASRQTALRDRYRSLERRALPFQYR